jgi:Protein of unknown function (DUF2281)
METKTPEAAEKEPVTIDGMVLAKLRTLPYEQQKQVLDFIEFLQQKQAPKRPRKSLKGLFADLGVHITEEDIAEARREMWGNFPRDLP